MRKIAAVVVLVIVAWSASAIASPAQIVPGAPLYVYLIEPYHSSGYNNTGPREVRLHIQATREAPAGPLSGMARLTIQRFGQTEPVETFEEPFDATVPPKGSQERAWDVTQVNFAWDAEPGLYNLTAELASDQGVVWSTTADQHQVGYSDDLASGWGRLVIPDGSEADLDGDGPEDLVLKDPATGGPVAWNMTITTHTVEINAEIRRELEVFFYAYPGGRGEAIATLPREAVARVITPGARMWAQANPPLELMGDEPEYTLHLPEIAPGGCCGYQFFVTSAEALPKLDAWYDGYEMQVNLTYVDLDADGAQDIHFWNSTVDTVEGASALDEDDRRGVPVQIEVNLVVRDLDNGTEVEFDLQRADRGHDGAWIELEDADEVFHEVLERDGDGPRGEPEIELQLPPEEGFVEKTDNASWAWIGHFSTQRMTVFVPNEPQTPAPCCLPSESRGITSSIGMALVAVTITLVAGLTRRVT
jgi:hypothetical protein